MVGLPELVTGHQNILGPNLQSLGRKNGLFLNFEQESGWSLVRLNCWQMLLRYLGCYQSTHLKTIANQIEREANIPPDLLAKINTSWMRRGGKGVPLRNAAPAPEPMRQPEPERAGEAAAVQRFQPLQQRDPQRIIADDLIEKPGAVLHRFGVYVGDTLISIVQGDLLLQNVDAIVNAAKNTLRGGGGVDGVIHAAAGPALLAECMAIPVIDPELGIRCLTGGAQITGAGNLQAPIKAVIHTVGPVYNEGDHEGSMALLKKAYRSTLDLARENNIRTIAFPSVSAGIFGFGTERASLAAIEEVEKYAHEHPGAFDEIRLVFLGNAFNAARNTFNGMIHPHAVRENFMQ